jgi:hypothetical protein
VTVAYDLFSGLWRLLSKRSSTVQKSRFHPLISLASPPKSLALKRYLEAMGRKAHLAIPSDSCEVLSLTTFSEIRVDVLIPNGFHPVSTLRFQAFSTS